MEVKIFFIQIMFPAFYTIIVFAWKQSARLINEIKSSL